MEDEKPVLEQMTNMMAEAAHVTKEAAKKAVKKAKKVAKAEEVREEKRREKDYEEKEEVETLDRLVVLQLCSLHGILSWEAYAVECEDQARGFLCSASDRVLRQVCTVLANPI